MKPKTIDELKTQPVGELQSFTKDVWIADGPNVYDMGFMFTTRMTIVKLSTGSVWVESPVPLRFETLKCITELGPVKYLVAATQRHVWRLKGWQNLFPEAQLWVPRTTLFTLGRGRLPSTSTLMDTPYDGWADDFDQLSFKGNPFIEEVLFFHKESRTVFLNDLIQINHMIKGKPIHNMVCKLEGVAYPHGGVPLDIRLSFINRNLARRSLEKLLSWDFDKLIIAHGNCIERREVIRRKCIPMANTLKQNLRIRKIK